MLIEAKDLDQQLDEVARRAVELSALERIGAGDIGVLVPTNTMVDRTVKRLGAEGVAAQKLDDYDGRPNDKVKVGTYHRAKGLEFKVVFLPALSKGVFPRPPQEGHSEEEPRRPVRDESATTYRRGDRPLLIEAKDLDHQLDEVARRVVELSALERVGSGDIGVLLPTNNLVDQTVKRLGAEGVAAQKLDDYDGRPNDKVKVGTYHRAKGLEFKVVFLPALSAGVFPRPPPRRRQRRRGSGGSRAVDLAALRGDDPSPRPAGRALRRRSVGGSAIIARTVRTDLRMTQRNESTQ